ncbi:hypothetical protein GUJ93_ZPchr0013g36731 [Zizania palustris]|uniref:Uncharacterized protein n=1 Tax=Zizania palustris TaxID=103762 RepID=A0A8J6BUW5_ZIZPA|nr:hypothetical protein GUJ93_ZPchr0013g36731 [Zizania palustris]
MDKRRGSYIERLEDLEPDKRKFEEDIEAQNKANEGRKVMLETQKRVSSEKLEAQKVAYLTAKENKEAGMLEAYRELLKQDTAGMAEDVRSEHVLALKCLRETIFSNSPRFCPTVPNHNKSLIFLLLYLIFSLNLPTMSDSSYHSDDSDELAPSNIIEEYAAEQSILDSFARRLSMKIKASFSARMSKRYSGPRKSIRRDHAGAHQRLVEDYFAEQPFYPKSQIVLVE